MGKAFTFRAQPALDLRRLNEVESHRINRLVDSRFRNRLLQSREATFVEFIDD